jgi:hypothetical protein
MARANRGDLWFEVICSPGGEAHIMTRSGLAITGLRSENLDETSAMKVTAQKWPGRELGCSSTRLRIIVRESPSRSLLDPRD